MTDTIRRGFDVLTKEEHLSAANGLISYFKSERDEEIGIIAAEDMLDFFMQHAGVHIYNRALDDARAVIQKELEDCAYRIDEIRK